MGASASTLTYVQPNNVDFVVSKVRDYSDLSKTHLTDGQTATFNQYATTDEVDFTDQFKMANLDKLFLKARTQEGFNCLGLFRQSQEGNVDIPILSDGNYTVLHPLGIPGRDLAPGEEQHGSRVSHLMCVKNTPQGEQIPYTFNDCLHTDDKEDEDFKARVEFLERAVLNLKDNVAISGCGEKVLSKAETLGLAPDTLIRDYFAKVICGLSDEVRTGKNESGDRTGPGYQLTDAGGQDVAQDCDAIKSLIYELYSSEDLKTFTAVQPPSHNTQILSHIHTFQLQEMPACMNQNYFDVHTIMKAKEDMKAESPLYESEEEDDGELTRQSTIAGSSR
jgi:hypothetical protein